MSAVLTRDQADLLAAYGWQTADILIHPDRGISDAKASQSCAVSDSWSWQTTSRGIVGGRGRRPLGGGDVTVTWSEIRAAAKAVPDRLLADLGAARRRTHQEWVRHFPDFAPWAPGGRAAWVAPPPDWHRDAQAAQRAAIAACLDALTVEPDGVPGQLDLFQVAS